MQALKRCGYKKAAVYDLLRTGMVGGPAQVLTRYHEKDITHIRSHVYGEKSKLTKDIIGYDANALYLHCSSDVMPCGKDMLVVNKKPFDQKRNAKFSKDLLKEKILCLRRFMTSSARWHHYLFFRRFLIVIYLRK